MWQPVYKKYRLFFEMLGRLQPIVNEMTKQPVAGHVADVARWMVLSAANTYGALLTLVLNGYGQDAMKLARSIYETELNIVWLKKHPDDIHDFLEYNTIQWKQLYDAMDEEQQKELPKEDRDLMLTKYPEAVKRFATGRDKTRPRNDWCRLSIYDRAKEAGLLPRHRSFYLWASSMHHGDVNGLISQMNSDLEVERAPSWRWLEVALESGLGSLVLCINHFNEIAGLSFKDRLAEGPNKDFVDAIKSLHDKPTT